MYFKSGLIALATIAAQAALALAAHPIVPPQNPSSNGQYSGCGSREECLTYINNVRAEQEGLDPISLPGNWGSMSLSQRLFTFMNLERTSRGIAPLQWLVSTYNPEVSNAIRTNSDPEAPRNIDSSWRSIWAGGSDMIVLSAMYGWMYNDGPGGFNIDCRSGDMSGCYGHRDNILAANVNCVSALAGQGQGGGNGFAALFWQADAPSQHDVVSSWSRN